MRNGIPSHGDVVFRRLLAGLLLVSGALLGGLGAGRGGLAAGAAGGLAAAALLLWLIGRRQRRRRALLATPFPDGWRAALEKSCEAYRRLPEERRRRFENDVRVFVAEKSISGVGADVDDELRLLVAASAVTLSLGWPAFDWEPLGDVLLYPEDFDRDYGAAAGDDDDRAGETHPWGTVLLSIPALRESFAEPGDGFHVGFHEFAHLLDLEQTEFDGMPFGLGDAELAEWATLRETEMRRLRKGRSVLDPYGAEDEVEFFPVAVEAFFDCPGPLRARHRELYALLSAYFRQDPAEDEARAASR